MKLANLAQVVHLSSSGGTSSSSTSSYTSHFRRKSSKIAAQVTPKMVEEDKQFIARFSEQQQPLPPEEVQQDPRNKELGRSSRGLTVRDFELVRTLGTGTFARVWLVRLANPAEQDRDKVYALKVLRKAEVIKLKQVDHVNHERSVLADVAGHPFITTLITSFSDHDSLYMLLDYCPGGEVFSYLRKAKRFDEKTARFYAAEIVLILEFLHEREGVAYRDLKPENLLLDAEGHIKLVDFGFAKRLGNSKQKSRSIASRIRKRSSYMRNRSSISLKEEDVFSVRAGLFGQQQQQAQAKNNINGNNNTGMGKNEKAGFTESCSDCHQGETYTLCGTPEYLAPEVIQSKGHTTAVDWWALGILIYEFLTGYPPFWNQNPIEIYKQIVSKPISFPTTPTISPSAKDLIRNLCVVDRSKRLGNISGGAARVKSHPFFEGVNWDEVYYRRFKGPIIPPVRYPGDAQCFDTYPDEKTNREIYGEELRKKWDGYFADF